MCGVLGGWHQVLGPTGTARLQTAAATPVFQNTMFYRPAGTASNLLSIKNPEVSCIWPERGRAGAGRIETVQPAQSWSGQRPSPHWHPLLTGTLSSLWLRGNRDSGSGPAGASTRHLHGGRLNAVTGGCPMTPGTWPNMPVRVGSRLQAGPEASESQVQGVDRPSPARALETESPFQAAFTSAIRVLPPGLRAPSLPRLPPQAGGDGARLWPGTGRACQYHGARGRSSGSRRLSTAAARVMTCGAR